MRGVPESNDHYFTQFDVQRDARKIMKDYPDLRAAVQDVSAFSGSGFRQAMIDFNLRGPDLAKLQQYSDKIMAWMKTATGLRRRRHQPLAPQAGAAREDRPRAGVATWASPCRRSPRRSTCWSAASRSRSTRRSTSSTTSGCAPSLPFRDKPEAIGRLMVPSPKAGLVQLTSLATLGAGQGPGHDRPLRHAAASGRHRQPGGRQAAGRRRRRT